MESPVNEVAAPISNNQPWGAKSWKDDLLEHLFGMF